MQTWIFQCNPDDFDVEGYLASRPAEVVWLVTRYPHEIGVGDRVYIWRNQGTRQATSGVIAEAVVIAAPQLRPEAEDAVRFWRTEGPRSDTPQVRALLRLVKIANNREVIRRNWCLEDPILKDLPNLRMAAATNYRLTPRQALRMDALWSRTGRDWTRNEAIAGLWVYDQTYGQSVSSLPGSPVAKVALLIGRAVSGVYAKVMNFRSVDPRAVGEGMSGASETDRAVWREFFDESTSSFRVEALGDEFARIWGSTQSREAAPPEASATAAIIADEAQRLAEVPLEQLLTKYAAQAHNVPQRPATRVLDARVYDRNPLIIAIARSRAKHRCEIKDGGVPSFKTPDWLPDTEVHHIVPLANGGEDTIENVACLCPTHHREVHHGERAIEITNQLKALRAGRQSGTIEQRLP